MKHFLLILTVLALPVSAIAQGRVSGTVLDGATNLPLAGAVVMIDSVRFAVADAKGLFSVVDVPWKDASSFSVAFMGYSPHVKTIKVSQAVTNLGVITLYEAPTELERIVVVGEAVIAIQKGDTTQYLAAAFKTNPDAYAADLINKMPGMSVDGGSIEVQGEPVTRVYVDGLLTYGDDPMTALNNIPADAIEGIEMFDELSDEAKFTGYNDGRVSRSLNIVTKYKSKTTVDMTLEGGYGYELDKNMDGDYQNRYLLSGRALIINGENRFTINATTNNNNSSGGRLRGSGGGFGGSGLSTINDFNAGYSLERKDKLRFNANYAFNNTESERMSRRKQDYFPTEQYLSRIYADTSQTTRRTYTHRASLRIEYTLNANNRFKFTPNVSFSDNSTAGWSSVTSSTRLIDGTELVNRSHVVNNGNTDNYNVGGDLSWVRNLGKPGRNLSLSGSLKYSNSDANHLQRDDDPESSNPMNTVAYTSGKDNTARFTLRYIEPLSATTTLSANYSLGYQDSRQDKIVFDSLTMQYDDILSNVYTRNYTTNKVGVAYAYNKGPSRVNIDLEYEHRTMNKEQSLPVIAAPSSSYTFHNLLPDLEYKYTKDRTTFKLEYDTEVDLPSVEQLQNVIDNSNPLQLTAGNPNLRESYTHNVEMKYSTTDVEKSTTLSVSLKGSATVNSIATRTRFFTEDEVLPDYNHFQAQQGAQLRTPVNVDGRYTLRTNVNYSFSYKALKSKVNLGLNYGYQRTPFFSNEELNYSNANSAGFRAAIVSNISENVDFSISSNTGYNFANKSNNTDSKYLSQAFSGEVNLIFLGGFVFNSNITYNIRKNYSGGSDFDRNYTLWDAGLGHKFGRSRQAEIRLTMFDILKQNVSLNHTLSDNYIQDSWTNTMGRYVMLSFSYRFNSLNLSSQND